MPVAIFLNSIKNENTIKKNSYKINRFTLLVGLCALVEEVFAILSELLEGDNDGFDRLHGNLVILYVFIYYIVEYNFFILSLKKLIMCLLKLFVCFYFGLFLVFFSPILKKNLYSFYTLEKSV